MNGRAEDATWPFPRNNPLAPPPLLEKLRAQQPISKVRLWDGSEAWLATRYEDVRALLNDPRLSSDSNAEGFPLPAPSAVAMRGRPGEPVENLARMDPPKHRSHRMMLSADFMIKRVRSMKPFLDALVAERLDALEQMPQPVDMLQALALPIPTRVILHLLDLPASDSGFFQDRVQTAMSLDSEPSEALAAVADIQGYFDGVIESRIKAPGNDLVSRLVHEHMLTGDVTRSEMRHTLHLLLNGGFDTTANMIALGTLVFIENPEAQNEVRKSPELVDGAVEELLRYLSVAHHVAFRLAADDLEVNGLQIRRGDAVVAPIMAANHDPDAFPTPGRFDIHRDARAHLAFGYGIHQCLGQALARIELQIVFAAMLTRFKSISLGVGIDELRFRNGLIYGVAELPVFLSRS